MSSTRGGRAGSRQRNVPRRRAGRPGRVPASIQRLPMYREQQYRERRHRHQEALTARRRREIPTPWAVAAGILRDAAMAMLAGVLAWVWWPAVPPAAACAALCLFLTVCVLRPVTTLLLRRHPVQVRDRALCSACGGLFLPGRAIRRHARREEAAGHVPARWTTVRVR